MDPTNKLTADIAAQLLESNFALESPEGQKEILIALMDSIVTQLLKQQSTVIPKITVTTPSAAPSASNSRAPSPTRTPSASRTPSATRTPSAAPSAPSSRASSQTRAPSSTHKPTAAPPAPTTPSMTRASSPTPSNRSRSRSNNKRAASPTPPSTGNDTAVHLSDASDSGFTLALSRKKKRLVKRVAKSPAPSPMDTTPAPAPAPVAEKTTRKTTRKPLMAPPAPPKPLPAQRATGAAEAAKEKTPPPVFLRDTDAWFRLSQILREHSIPYSKATRLTDMRTKPPVPAEPLSWRQRPTQPNPQPNPQPSQPPQSGYSAADDLRLLREAARAINMKEVRLVAIKLRNCTDCFERALIMADHGDLFELLQ
ncbi:hypothetical protein ACJJTC_018557 [Scirpophaga incertulas]